MEPRLSLLGMVRSPGDRGTRGGEMDTQDRIKPV